ncbi:MAG: molybdenum cofactor guanylyltransferase [Chloroflexi bacterium]|nr:molybdenum cofactor guanylyltransferase [Chloroflexota bacterium]
MLSLVIQAGGESRRMGQDKALMPFLGQTLIHRVLARLEPLQATEILVTTNRPENYLFLDLPLIPDRLPGRGALGGLFTALSAARQPLAAVVACDMPFASAGLLIAAQGRLLADATLQAVIPASPQGTEPFHAVYRREACLPLVQAAIRAEKWRVNAWFEGASIYFMPAAEIVLYDPHALAFWNVNTPAELEEAERRAQGAA